MGVSSRGQLVPSSAIVFIMSTFRLFAVGFLLSQFLCEGSEEIARQFLLPQ